MVVLCALSTLAWQSGSEASICDRTCKHICQRVNIPLQGKEVHAQALHRFPLRTAKLWKAKNVPKYEAATAVSISTAFA